MKLFPLCFAFLLTLAGFLSAEVPQAPAPGTPGAVQVYMRDGLRFDPPRFEATPGKELTIEVQNVDSTHQTHNFLVLKPGKLKEVVQKSMELGEKGPAQNFVPEGTEVLGHTAILNPDEKAVVRITVPTTPGIYPYVCTFPGHGMIMYGAIYAGVPMPALSKDPNLPPTVPLTGGVAGKGKRPFVQRMFMPDAGPAAIAVALNGDANLCWDSDQGRVRYAWQGQFLDASEHWRGNGRDLAKVLGTLWWTAASDDLAIRFDSAKAVPAKLRFLGYKLFAGIPEFHSSAGACEVFQTPLLPRTTPEKPGLTLHYRILKAPGPVFLGASPQQGRTWTSSAGKLANGMLMLTAQEASDFTLTLR